MLLLLTANMIVECPRTDCNRLGDIKKNCNPTFVFDVTLCYINCG
jgi:hypothetical protein